MRVACTILGLALAAGGSRADADVELVEDSAMPSTDAFFFTQTFEGGDVFGSGGWKKSGSSKYAGQPVSVELDSGAKDTSMLFKSANKHYGVGSKFAKYAPSFLPWLPPPPTPPHQPRPPPSHARPGAVSRTPPTPALWT